MTKIYNDAKDKNVATVVLYANEENALFTDAACTKEFDAANDGLDAFLKGVVAVKAGVYYKPISCTEAGVINFGLATA